MRLPHLLRKWVSLDNRDRLELVPATLSVLSVRLRQRLFPFPRVLRWADTGSDGAPCDGESLDRSTERRIRAVERVGHQLFPHNPCLTEALAVHRLLRRNGYGSKLRIGVRKHSHTPLEAHAWVEYLGGVVIGARGLSEDHIPLPPLGVSGRPSKTTKEGTDTNAI